MIVFPSVLDFVSSLNFLSILIHNPCWGGGWGKYMSEHIRMLHKSFKQCWLVKPVEQMFDGLSTTLFCTLNLPSFSVVIVYFHANISTVFIAMVELCGCVIYPNNN